MPRKNEEEIYSEWCSEIAKAERLLKKRIERANDFMRLYRQDLAYIKDILPADTSWTNYQFGLSKIIIPSIYIDNPEFMVAPRQPGQLAFGFAKLCTDLLNYHIDEIDLEGEVRTIILDSFVWGLGILKLGYAPVLGKKKKWQYEISEETGEMFEETFEDEEQDQEFEPDQRISNDLPFAIRWSPRYFLMDPLATTDKDARWQIFRVLKPVREVKASKNYDSGVTSGIQAMYAVTEDGALEESSGVVPALEGGTSGTTRSSELIMLYEIWDRETDSLLVMDSWNMYQGKKRFLRKSKRPYTRLEGFPSELLVFNEDPEIPYGIADMEIWDNPAKLINLINSHAYRHIWRFHRKYLADRAAFEGLPEEEAKLLNPYDGAVIKVNTKAMGRGLSDSVVPLQDAPVTPDMYHLREEIRNNLTFVSHVTEQRRGVVERAKTATEASFVEQQARIGDSDRVRTISRFVQNAGRKLLQLNREFLTGPTVFLLTGSEHSYLWDSQAPHEIEKEVQVKVRVGSSAYISKEIKVKQLIDLLAVGSKVAGPDGLPVLNGAAVIQRIADEMGIEDYQSLLNPPMLPSPAGPASPVGGPPGGNGAGNITPGRGRPNLGNMLSEVQNLGVQRTPNPTEALGG